MRVICGTQFFSKYFHSKPGQDSGPESSRAVLDVGCSRSGVVSTVWVPPTPDEKQPVDSPTVEPKDESVSVEIICSEVPKSGHGTLAYHAKMSLGQLSPIVEVMDDSCSGDMMYRDLPGNKSGTVTVAADKSASHFDSSDGMLHPLPSPAISVVPSDSLRISTSSEEPKDKPSVVIIYDSSDHRPGNVTSQAEETPHVEISGIQSGALMENRPVKINYNSCCTLPQDCMKPVENSETPGSVANTDISASDLNDKESVQTCETSKKHHTQRKHRKKRIKSSDRNCGKHHSSGSELSGTNSHRIGEPSSKHRSNIDQTSRKHGKMYTESSDKNSNNHQSNDIVITAGASKLISTDSVQVFEDPRKHRPSTKHVKDRMESSKTNPAKHKSSKSGTVAAATEIDGTGSVQVCEDPRKHRPSRKHIKDSMESSNTNPTERKSSKSGTLAPASEIDGTDSVQVCEDPREHRPSRKHIKHSMESSKTNPTERKSSKSGTLAPAPEIDGTDSVLACEDPRKHRPLRKHIKDSMESSNTNPTECKSSKSGTLAAATEIDSSDSVQDCDDPRKHRPSRKHIKDSMESSNTNPTERKSSKSGTLAPAPEIDGTDSVQDCEDPRKHRLSRKHIKDSMESSNNNPTKHKSSKSRTLAAATEIDGSDSVQVSETPKKHWPLKEHRKKCAEPINKKSSKHQSYNSVTLAAASKHENVDSVRVCGTPKKDRPSMKHRKICKESSEWICIKYQSNAPASELNSDGRILTKLRLTKNHKGLRTELPKHNHSPVTHSNYKSSMRHSEAFRSATSEQKDTKQNHLKPDKKGFETVVYGDKTDTISSATPKDQQHSIDVRSNSFGVVTAPPVVNDTNSVELGVAARKDRSSTKHRSMRTESNKILMYKKYHSTSFVAGTSKLQERNSEMCSETAVSVESEIIKSGVKSVNNQKLSVVSLRTFRISKAASAFNDTGPVRDTSTKHSQSSGMHTKKRDSRDNKTDSVEVLGTVTDDRPSRKQRKTFTEFMDKKSTRYHSKAFRAEAKHDEPQQTNNNHKRTKNNETKINDTIIDNISSPNPQNHLKHVKKSSETVVSVEKTGIKSPGLSIGQQHSMGVQSNVFGVSEAASEGNDVDSVDVCEPSRKQRKMRTESIDKKSTKSDPTVCRAAATKINDTIQNISYTLSQNQLKAFKEGETTVAVENSNPMSSVIPVVSAAESELNGTVDEVSRTQPLSSMNPVEEGSETARPVGNIDVTSAVISVDQQNSVDVESNGFEVSAAAPLLNDVDSVEIIETTTKHQPSRNHGDELTESCRDSNNNRNSGNGENSVEDIPLPAASGDERKEAEVDGPSQVLAWVADASKEFTPKLGTPDIKELENMISLYLAKVSSCISKCYVPNRAAKMKRCMNDVLMFFNFLYQEIAEDKKAYSTYLDKMTELMAYYIDMEIQASSRAKENPLVIASKLTSSLFIFLDRSHDHILDSILKANNVNKNFWELCSLIFSGVLKDTPNKIMSELTYVRYILAYKMWKRVVQGPDERKRVMSLASLRLKQPPLFVEKIRAGLLNGIIPKVPKKRCDVTTFLIQAKFDVKEKAKAFLKYVAETKTNVMFVPAVPSIKTDIPLFVGYLPDFGPSLSLVKLDPPNLDEDDSYPRKVDMSGSRLMNEVWTSINHEASFREAVRMQNVTTFNRTETKVSEKKKIHCVLKHKKVVRPPAGDEPLPAGKNVPDLADKPTRPNSPEITIVLSDDSEKGIKEAVEVPRKSRVKRVSNSPPVVRMKQERISPTRTDLEPPSPKPTQLSNKEVLPEVIPAVAKRPLINPSQIKREIDNDDVIIMESPEPTVVLEPEADEVDKDKEVHVEDHRGGSTVELEVSVSLKKSEIYQPNSPYMVPISDRFAKESGAVTDKPCDLKEEKVLEIPEKEKEIGIRINKDIFDKIKYQEGEKEMMIDDGPTKSVETTLPDSDNKISGSTDSNKDELKAASPDKKSDSALFDDEENSWSPGGGSQEFFRNVVDTFISRYLPVDDVETRLGGSNAASDSPLEIVAVDGNKDGPSCESSGDAIDKKAVEQNMPMDSNEEPDDQSDPSPDSLDATSPPSKKSRLSDDLPSVPATQIVDSAAVSKPIEQTIAPEEPIEQPSTNEDEEEFPDPVLRAVHNNTCRWDHIVFLLQTKLRDVLPTNIHASITSPIEIDPETGKAVERCSCSQCVGNYKALIFNHKALVGFQNEVLKASEEGGSGASTAEVSSTSDQLLQPKQEKDDSLEQEEDGSESHADSLPQLPFKKRKALLSSDKERRDDGESQHSDTSKDGMTADYPATPMLSIALLASTTDSYSSPPLPDSNIGCNYSSTPPLVTAVDSSYTSSLCGVTTFSSTSSMPGRYCDPQPLPQTAGCFPYSGSTETLNPASLPGSYNSAPPKTDLNMLATGFGANYGSTYTGSTRNASHELSGYSGPSSSRPPGGGFPPFSAVIPPLTNFPDVSRLGQQPVESMAPYSTPSVDRPTRRSVATRRFVTPAQLKQAFIAEEGSSSYCDPISCARKHIPSAPETRSSRSRKEPSSSSRKSSRSTRKKK